MASRYRLRLGWRVRAFSLTVATLIALLLTGSLLAFGQATPTFDRVTIGSFDPDAWNGVVFLTQAFHQPANFALRVGSESGGGFLDGIDIFNAVGEVGPHAPDGSYCRIGWRNLPREALITLEWSRLNQTTVVGRLSAGPRFRLVLETYFPAAARWGSQGFYSIDRADNAILGERFFNRIFGPAARFLVMSDRPLLGDGSYASLAQLDENMRGSGRLNSSPADDAAMGAAGIEFVTGDSGTAHFVAEVGWDRKALINKGRSLLQPGKIDSILQEKSQAYVRGRPKVTGLFEGAAQAIGNSMFWNTLYAPSNGLVFPSISRHWAQGWGGWVVGEWDCFFGSLLTSLENKPQTDAGVKAILLAQTPTGLVPNMASGSGTTPDRSQPPVGSYCVWKEYQRFHDLQMLKWAYPRLKKWHEWWFHNRGDGQPWRDGNRDGLLEWGSDRGSSYAVGGSGFLQAAKWESGMDDSPMWDHASYDPRTYTMNLDDVGLNSLYALDAECLSRIATILGQSSDGHQFTAEYVQTKRLMQAKLWNDRDGIYENRYWDGRFSRRLSPTNFYPLFAGIATPEQARRMVEGHLLNPKEFWGKYVIPTIARNDPAFVDQFYWRGDIWGPTNYMVYEGLNRYRFDKVALEYAEKNYNLFMDDWKQNQHDDEQYHAWGGNGGGDTHYTWGALLCLVGLEQYIDENPWEGLRFGALDPPSAGEFKGARWEDHTYDVSVGPDRTLLYQDGKPVFEADAGVVVRDYQVEPSGLSFNLHSSRATRVTLREIHAGTLAPEINGKNIGRLVVSGRQVSINVPAGEQLVVLKTNP